MARNLARMKFRSGARRRQRESLSELAAPTSESGAEELVQRLQIQRQIAAKVTELEEPFRQAIILRYYEGLSAAAVSQQLEPLAGTIRWRLKKAMDQLRAQMGEDHRGSRQALSVLIAPLGSSKAELTTTSSTASAALQGTIYMSTAWKLIAAAVVLVLFGGGTKMDWFGTTGSSESAEQSLLQRLWSRLRAAWVPPIQ